MKKSFAFFFIGLLGLLPGASIFISVHAAGSAALSILPSSGSYAVGKTFTVSVMLDSGGTGVNAADGKISFDPTLLTVQSVSKGNSIFNLWVADPSFSNTDGTIDFSGGGTNAYTGSSGDVFDIVFKAQKAGTASASFLSGSALAADGQGTDVLGAKNGATFTLGGTGSSGTTPPASPAPSGSPSSNNSFAATAAPPPPAFTPSITISSPTDPDSGKWYNANTASFAWQLTSDVAGVSTVFDKKPGTIPRRISEGLPATKQYSNVTEGASYFHIRFEDAIGNWSDTMTYEIQVDLTSPEPFTVNAQPDGGLNGKTLLAWNATDTVSGIDHYEAVFDGNTSSTIAPSDLQNGVYTAPPLLPGKHVVAIKAFDKAGNSNEADVAFDIQGVAMPNITNFPATVIESSPIVLEGVADNGSNVTVTINDANGKTVSEGKMIADETGHWLYAIESGLSTGKYVLGVSMLTKQGAFASSTLRTPMSVISAPFLDRFGWALVVLLIACIAGLVAFGFYRKKLIAMQLTLAKRENEEARERTKAVFEALREEVDDQISHMEGGAAQAQGEVKLEPEHVLDAMRTALAVSETTIQKEIDDVDKALTEE